MSNTQEICRVEILWLEAGDVCLHSELGLNAMNHKSLAIFDDGGDDDANIIRSPATIPSRRCKVDKQELLRALHSYMDYKPGASVEMQQVHALDQGYSPTDPPVEVLVPVVVYSFYFSDSQQSWLSYLIDSDGLETFAKESLKDLLNTGYYLWHHGQVTDDGRWGVRVSFYTLWTIEVGYGEDPDVDWWLEGWVDPRKVTETKLPLQTKPDRRSTLAHRTFSIFT